MSNTYVSLKELADFNKYTTSLGAGAMVYFDKMDQSFGHFHTRTFGILLSAVVVVIGVVVMSARGRLKGDDFEYGAETGARLTLFKLISGALTTQLVFLIGAVVCAGYLSLARIWRWA